MYHYLEVLGGLVIQEEEAYSDPTEFLEDEEAGAELVDDAESGPHRGVGGVERARVALDLLQDIMDFTDAEGVEMVRTRMTSEDVERATDAVRIEEVMAEMGAEIRVDRGKLVESRRARGEKFSLSPIRRNKEYRRWQWSHNLRRLGTESATSFRRSQTNRRMRRKKALGHGA